MPDGRIIRSTGSTGQAKPPITLDVTIETREIELLLVKVERHRYVFCFTGKNGCTWLPCYVYQECGNLLVEISLFCLHECENRHDRYTMAVYRSDAPGIVVRHLPKEISKMCYYFIKHDGKVSGKVTGCQQYSGEAGGLEVPCKLKFSGSARKVRNSCSRTWILQLL